MPFFSKKSPKMSVEETDNKSKLENQLYLAEYSPEPIIDLSSCGLTNVPSQVFSLCKVLRKEFLCLQDNKITKLTDENLAASLENLQCLELQHNKITLLPSSLGYLPNLKILNLSNNRLKSLPSSFINLTRLKELNLIGNKFTEVPAVICNVESLQILKMQENAIKILPLKLCNLRHLCNLFIDIAHLVFPNPEISKLGTESIMRFLCSESGKDYVPPEKYLAAEEDLLPGTSSGANEAATTNTSAAKNQKHLNDIENEYKKMEKDLIKIQDDKEEYRKQTLKQYEMFERQCCCKIEELLKRNEEAKNTQMVMKKLEKDTSDMDSLLEVKSRELEDLRKNDVLRAMQVRVLADAELHDCLDYDHYKHDSLLGANYSENNDVGLMQVLKRADEKNKKLVAELLLSEEYQREAFENLYVKRDKHRNGIINEIAIVEAELASVTAIELKNRKLNYQLTLGDLASNRQTLAGLLEQLTRDRNEREREIRAHLKRLDEVRSVENHHDYWLVQYQRLMEDRSRQFNTNISTLDRTVQSMLVDASAQDFIPLFASKRINLDKFLNLNDIALNELGIVDDLIRANIMKQISCRCPEAATNPSAPPIEDDDSIASAPQEEPSRYNLDECKSSFNIVKFWVEAECVVCLDNKCEVIFLSCGHVCSCLQCSLSIDVCPLCRNSISNKLPMGASFF